MKTLFALLILPLSSHADGLALHATPEPVIYQCQLILSADDLKEPADWSFVSTSGGSHGGDPLVFRKDGHEIDVLVDKQWLGISWQRQGKKVAETEFVVGSVDKPDFKVGILRDPGHEGDQVALSCALKK